VYIEGDLRVAGVVEGEVEVTGDVEIDDMARVKASLSGQDVNIRGHVDGAVVARKRLIVGRSGSLIGDVRVARLVIQDGARFSGKVAMGAAAVEAPAKAAEAPAPAQPAVVAVSEEVPELPAPVKAAIPLQVPAERKDGKAKGKVPPPKGKPKGR
jgi:cytoskeletal protein CcmA (bactofilin family)